MLEQRRTKISCPALLPNEGLCFDAKTLIRFISFGANRDYLLIISTNSISKIKVE